MKLGFSQVDWHAAPVKREKIIFFVALFIFLIGFMKSCWQPSNRAIRMMKEEVKTAQSEKQVFQDILSKAGAMTSKASLGANKEEWAIYNKMANNIAIAPDAILMREFSSPAILRGVRLYGVEFESPTNQSGVVTQKWKMKLGGSFETIGQYLERLENLPIILIIRSVGIDVVTNGFGHIDVDLEGIAYGWK